MTEARWKQVMDNQGLVLREEEWCEGWHFCDDFDGLLVGPGMNELAHCHCEFSDSGVQAIVNQLRNEAKERLASERDFNGLG